MLGQVGPTALLPYPPNVKSRPRSSNGKRAATPAAANTTKTFCGVSAAKRKPFEGHVPETHHRWLTMAKKKSTMTVRIPDSGREIEVPTGLTGSALQRHVQGVLEAEALAAQQAEAAKLATAQQAEEDRFAALERELASERAKQDALHKEIAELKRVSPEAASMATVLSQMTREAERCLRAQPTFAGGDEPLCGQARQRHHRRGQPARPAKRNAGCREEERRRASRKMMDELRIQQGLAPMHPELMETGGTDAE